MGKSQIEGKLDAQNGCPARPQRVKGRGVPAGYGEGLNDARTPLADIFSIQLHDLHAAGAFDELDLIAVRGVDEEKAAAGSGLCGTVGDFYALGC